MRVAMLGESFNPYRTANDFFGADGPAPKTAVGQAILDVLKLGITEADSIATAVRAKGFSDEQIKQGMAEVGFLEENKNVLITGAVVLALAAIVFVSMRKRRRR